MQIKNFGLTGVASDVQLGKAGPRVMANTGSVEARAANGLDLTTVKIANGIALSDAVTVAQLNVLSSEIDAISNTVTSTDGFAINLGNVVADGDGSWSPGAVVLTDSTTVSDAVDQLNEVLAKLVPTAPPNFPNANAITITSVGSSPLLAANGVTDNSGNSPYTAGGSVTRITAATVASANTFNDMGPGDSGTMQLLVNGSVVGSRALTGTGDNGSYSGLVIGDQKDFPVATPGFWKSIDTSISAASVLQGINKVRLNHTGASATAEAFFVRDNVTSTPALSSGSIAQNAAGTLAYSSSVPHYGSGASLTANLSISNLAGETYYGGSDPLVVSGTNSIIASQTFNYATLGITTPINRQTTAATAITPITVSMNGSNVFASGTIQGVVRNVNGAASATNIAATSVLVMVGTQSGKVYEMSVPVSGLGSSPNANNAVRISIGSGDNPSDSRSTWVSADALATHEAAVVAGVLGHNQTNYSTGFLPAGPNLSVGRSGAQYATFAFQRTATSTFRIVVAGSYAGCWVKLPGVSDNAGISPNGATKNGWWNMFQSYVGNGVPGQTGDTNAGCALGTVMTGSTGTFQATFGTQTSTNSTDNYIYVRFRLNSGQSITALSFTN